MVGRGEVSEEAWNARAPLLPGSGCEKRQHPWGLALRVFKPAL